MFRLFDHAIHFLICLVSFFFEFEFLLSFIFFFSSFSVALLWQPLFFVHEFWINLPYSPYFTFFYILSIFQSILFLLRFSSHFLLHYYSLRLSWKYLTVFTHTSPSAFSRLFLAYSISFLNLKLFPFTCLIFHSSFLHFLFLNYHFFHLCFLTLPSLPPF